MRVHNLSWIDFYRGVAILAVLFAHTLNDVSNVFLKILHESGPKGVQLFYIISAYTLLRSFRKRRAEFNPIANFFIRRFFRIAPLFYLAIIIWLTIQNDISYNENDYRSYSLFSVFFHIIFLHGLSPYWQDSLVPGGWSIAVESLFYISFPLLIQKIDSIKKCLIWLIASVYFSNSLVWFLEHSIWLSKINKDILSGYLYGFYPAQFHVFIFGFLLFLIEDLNFILKLKYLFFVAISILPLALADFYWLDLTQLNNFYVSWFIVLFISITKDFLMQKNYLFSLIQAIGKISFGIYLFDFMILFFLHKNSTFDEIIDNYQLGLFLIVFTSSSLISIFFYKLLEKPFIRFGADLIYKFENIK